MFWEFFILSAPSLDDTTQKRLFRVICDVSSKTVYNPTIMAVSTQSHSWRCHIRSKRKQDMMQ